MSYTYLSSRATPFYKFIPVLFFTITSLFILGSITFLPKKHVELYLPFSIFLVIFTVSLSPLLFIKKVYYSNDLLYLSNYNKKSIIEVHNVKEVKMFLFYFYKIIYKDNSNRTKSVIFIPHIFEKLSNPFGSLDSIKQFKKLLKNRVLV